MFPTIKEWNLRLLPKGCDPKLQSLWVFHDALMKLPDKSTAVLQSRVSGEDAAEQRSMLASRGLHTERLVAKPVALKVRDRKQLNC